MMKKNFLFVLPSRPWPLDSGGNQAMFNGILAASGCYNIFITYPVLSESDLSIDSQFFNCLGINATILPILKKNIRTTTYKRLRHLVLYLKRKIFKNDNDVVLEKLSTIDVPDSSIIDAVCSFVKQYGIHVVQVEMNGMMSIVDVLPSNVKKIFVHHEIKFVRSNLTLKKLIVDSSDLLKVEMAKDLEIALLNRYDGIIVLSKIDKTKLEEAGVKSPVFESFAIVNSKGEDHLFIDNSHTLCFVGTESHQPNYIGLMWFLDNCWNQLLSVDKEYKLKVIGKWTKKTVSDIQKKYAKVLFTGFVKDLQEELKNSIMIVPITIGSGIRMKILEAGSMGIPVVSTLVGAEGLPLVDGENAYLTDNPNSFIEDILKLRDRELRCRFAKNLRDIIRDNYSLERLSLNRKSIYEEVVS